MDDAELLKKRTNRGGFYNKPANQNLYITLNIKNDMNIHGIFENDIVADCNCTIYPPITPKGNKMGDLHE